MHARRALPTIILAVLAAPLLAQSGATPAKPGETPKAGVPGAPEGLSPDSKAMMDAYTNASKPSAAHQKLAPLIGEWDVVTRVWMDPSAPPMEMKSTVKKTWEYGNRFIKEDVAGTDPTGQAYTGVGYLGFDAGSKQYQGVWISSTMTGMVSYTGKANDDGKSFTFTGKESDPTGASPPMDFKVTLTIDSPDKHTLTLNYVVAGAGEIKGFEMVHTRKK